MSLPKTEDINCKGQSFSFDNSCSHGRCCQHHKPAYYKVLEQGTYYYPAWKHYEKITTVVCDRCEKSNLRACVGLGSQDLCMMCIEELTRSSIDSGWGYDSYLFKN
jgi:hypothetical protein